MLDRDDVAVDLTLFGCGEKTFMFPRVVPFPGGV
jgi:hypothetical protein